MRLVLGLLAALVAAGAQAQPVAPVPAEIVKTHVRLGGAEVVQVLFRIDGQRVCGLEVEAVASTLRLSWTARADRTRMSVQRINWRFPSGSVTTPVEVFFDARKLGRSDDGQPLPHVQMQGRGDMLTHVWDGDLATLLDGVKEIRLSYAEGLGGDDRFRVPEMRILLLGLQECRAEIDEAAPQ